MPVQLQKRRSAHNTLQGVKTLVSTALFSVFLLVFGACSSPSSLQSERLEGSSETLTTVLPEDLKKQFEVQEVPPAENTLAVVGKIKGSAAAGSLKSGKGKSSKAGKNAGEKPTKLQSRRTGTEPIWIGEKAVYDVTYFGAIAGELTVGIAPFKMINGRKAYHAVGTAQSSKMFSVFYRVNDRIESFMDYEGLYSHRFQMLLDETRQQRNSLELNDSEKGRSFFWSRRQHVTKGNTEIKEFFPMQPYSQDSLSALFYLRFLPLKMGSSDSFYIMSEGKNWEAIANVIRKEKIKTEAGTFDTLVIKPDTRFQGVLQKKGDSYIWITDDDRRLVVQIDAKVKIGTVSIRLKSYEKGIPPNGNVAGGASNGGTAEEIGRIPAAAPVDGMVGNPLQEIPSNPTAEK